MQIDSRLRKGLLALGCGCSIYDPTVDEYRYDSLHVRQHEALADFAREFFPPGADLLTAVTTFTKAIYEQFTYDPTSTDISTPPLTVLGTKRGVCQDFAHLAVGALRSLGIATAYISGYLETQPPAGQKRLVGADASHAWFAVWDQNLG